MDAINAVPTCVITAVNKTGSDRLSNSESCRAIASGAQKQSGAKNVFVTTSSDLGAINMF